MPSLAGHLATVICFLGQDALDWLQGQCTQDVRLLTPQKPVETLLLDQRGKILDLACLAVWQDYPAVVTTRPLVWAQRVDELVVMEDVSLQVAGEGHVPANDQTALVRHGHPHVDDLTDNLLPNEFGKAMERLVGLEKGCYVGQEIVHRIYARGTPKTLFTLIASPKHLHPNSALSLNNQTVGTTRRTAQTDDGSWIATAFVRSELAQPGTALDCEGSPVVVREFEPD